MNQNEQNPLALVYSLESDYFGTNQSLNLHITGARWKTNHQDKVKLDLKNVTAESLPDFITFESANWKNNGYELVFLEEYSPYLASEGGEVYGHFLCINGEFYDESGEMLIGQAESTDEKNGVVRYTYKPKDFDGDFLWVVPTYQSTTEENIETKLF